jgi:CYTH domain-containing protein
MPIEIERKFLLANDGWRAGVVQSDHFTDGLVARVDGRKVRVRLSDNCAWLTVKGPRIGISRHEFEYEIPRSDALIMLQSLCAGPPIEKIRHIVPVGGLNWAIDIHLGALEGIEFAEVELSHADDHLPLPSWAGTEVTHDPLLRKEALLARCVLAAAMPLDSQLRH